MGEFAKTYLKTYTVDSLSHIMKHLMGWLIVFPKLQNKLQRHPETVKLVSYKACGSWQMQMIILPTQEMKLQQSPARDDVSKFNGALRNHILHWECVLCVALAIHCCRELPWLPSHQPLPWKAVQHRWEDSNRQKKLPVCVDCQYLII